ncbi:MAG: putative zinc-binding metallopeptidase [Proteobacteria bacterium]|nr:putative zinc-binding metallopeptidase [Pseudomonadota bacterium]
MAQAAPSRAVAARHSSNIRKRAVPLPWTRLSDEELLSLRFCDLDLSIERSPLKRRVNRLYTELEGRGINVRPHVWLAEEWFSPDGVPGIAVPFYLAHPRLEKLERHIMREVEGGNFRWFMRILRHEAGHAVDNAYRLRRRKRWREVFGPASLQYPHHYKARPGSRRYVHHLGEWYAQAHPTEDFAETFAVWLKPNSNWRRSYATWPAFNKLSAVEELVASVRGKRAPVRNQIRIEPLEDNTRTLADHYRRRLARNDVFRRGLADEILKRIYDTERPRQGALRASSFMRANKNPLIDAVARELDMERYSIHQILRMLIERSESLKLFVRGNQRDALRHTRWMLGRLARLYSQGETPQLRL